MSLVVIDGGYKLTPLIDGWNQNLSSKPSRAFLKIVNNWSRAIAPTATDLNQDRFWFFSTEDQSHARISVVNPTSTQITEVNSPGWQALKGYTGNGTNSYLNTNYNFSTNGVTFTQDVCSVGFYSLTNSAAATMVDIGAVSSGASGAGVFSNIKSAAGTYNWNINSANAVIGSANTDSRGLFQLTRTSSSLQTSYRNGVSVNTNSNASTAPVNLNCFILAWNAAGSPGNFSSRQLPIAFMGGYTDPLRFYTAYYNLIATPLGIAV